MSLHCFVIVHLDTSKHPPVFRFADTHGVNAENLPNGPGSRCYAFTVAAGNGQDYPTAKTNALRQLLSPALTWVRLLLDSDDRATVQSLAREARRTKL